MSIIGGTRRDPFGFDADHLVEMRAEYASSDAALPAHWPCEIVRRAARELERDVDKRPITVGGADRSWQALVARAWEHQGDDMGDRLAHLHRCQCDPAYAVYDESERYRPDWTATLQAALAYLDEDAPQAVA